VELENKKCSAATARAVKKAEPEHFNAQQEKPAHPHTLIATI
jgi:hypothetical protein